MCCVRTFSSFSFFLSLSEIQLEIDVEQVRNVNPKEIRPITEQDFVNSLKRIRRSVAPASVVAYEKWAKDFGDVTY